MTETTLETAQMAPANQPAYKIDVHGSFENWTAQNGDVVLEPEFRSESLSLAALEISPSIQSLVERLKTFAADKEMVRSAMAQNTARTQNLGRAVVENDQQTFSDGNARSV